MALTHPHWLWNPIQKNLSILLQPWRAEEHWSSGRKPSWLERSTSPCQPPMSTLMGLSSSNLLWEPNTTLTATLKNFDGTQFGTTGPGNGPPTKHASQISRTRRCWLNDIQHGRVWWSYPSWQATSWHGASGTRLTTGSRSPGWLASSTFTPR